MGEMQIFPPEREQLPLRGAIYSNSNRAIEHPLSSSTETLTQLSLDRSFGLTFPLWCELIVRKPPFPHTLYRGAERRQHSGAVPRSGSGDLYAAQRSGAAEMTTSA